jgi:pyruvate dehydrogenase E2 component (dihydrolipoamide acetyltransferase)
MRLPKRSKRPSRLKESDPASSSATRWAALCWRKSLPGVRPTSGRCAFSHPPGLGPQIDAAFLDGILRASRQESLRPWLERLVQDPAVITDAFVQAVVAQRADGDLTRAMEQVAARFFPDGTQRFSIGPDLARLRIPTRIVFGRQDRILPFSATRTLPGHVALHALDDCGHLPQLEHPDLCARIIDEVRRSA